MKTVIVDFAPKSERYSEVRLTFTTDMFKNVENNGYTFLSIAAKWSDLDNVSLETAMNPHSFFEKLWKFQFDEDDLQTILEAFNTNKVIRKDLKFFLDDSEWETKDEFIQEFYDRIENLAFDKLAKRVWTAILCQNDDEVEIKDLKITRWLCGLIELNSNSEQMALRLDSEFDDWAVSQDYGDFGFVLGKDKQSVSVKMHKSDC